jgi:hypothetical protein
MRKFVCATVCALAVVGYALADEYNLFITKIEDGKVTGKKFMKGKGKGEEVTVNLAKDAKIYKGKFDMDAKKMVKEGDAVKVDALSTAVKEAVKADSEKGGVFARVTTEGSGKDEKITELIYGSFKKKQ